MKQTITPQAGLNTIWVILIVFVLTLGAGAAGYFLRDQSANEVLVDKNDQIRRLQNELATPTPQAVATNQPQSQSDGTASQTTTYSSANLGFSVNVPAEWAGKWRYQENGAIGISTASATFYLINKETKYAEVVTVGKIPQDKYDQARASNNAIGNPDNLLKSANGFAYVMTFADGSVGDYKDFTYAQATSAARQSFKASFKLL